MLVHQSIIVKGKVQGVFYRASAKQMADKLNIKGFVQNLPDGSVGMEAEGDESAMREFIEWCNIGPKNAVVTDVNSTAGEWLGYKLFDINKNPNPS
jgi:acylphosphatase